MPAARAASSAVMGPFFKWEKMSSSIPARRALIRFAESARCWIVTGRRTGGVMALLPNPGHARFS